MSPEELIDHLRARDDMPQNLVDKLTDAMIEILQRRIAVLEAEKALLEAMQRGKGFATLIDRNIFTAREVEIMREVEAGIAAMERWRADQ